MRPSLVRSLAVAALVAVTAAGGAAAATFTVDASFDAVDAAPGDGICATASGECTLRAAVLEGNALAGLDTVVLPAGTYDLTLPFVNSPFTDNPESGDLDVADDLSITGAGAASTVVRGAFMQDFVTRYPDRILQVAPGITATIAGVTLRGGSSLGQNGGGILNGGDLTLTDSVVTGNAAGYYAGMGLYTYGPGGGIANSGTLLLQRCTVRNNSFASAGGGIYNTSTGTLTVEDSAITGNDAPGFGGGIDNAGTLLVVNSTISGNHSGGQTPPPMQPQFVFGGIGGGLRSCAGSATLVDTTVAGNDVVAGTWPLLGCSILDGSAFATGSSLAGTFTLHSTIIDDDSPVANCFGTMTSLGHNVGGDTSCALTGTGDLSGVDPTLGPLQDNGGPTDTHALLAGSPAIDAGDAGGCPAGDQRGLARPVGAACDVGAYESNLPCGNGVVDVGEACDTGVPGDGCCSLACQLEPAGTACAADANGCTDDQCGGAGTCQHLANAAPCSDSNPCTLGDTCSGGACGSGAQMACALCEHCFPNVGSCIEVPRPMCHEPVVQFRSQLVLVQDSSNTRDAVSFKWRKGAETLAGAFGNPAATDAYALCVYTPNGLKFRAEAPVGGTCGTGPCWTALGGGGFRYRDRAKSTNGFASILLKPGAAERARVLVSTKGLTLPPLPPLPLQLPVTAQFQASNGECWSAGFTAAGLLVNDGARFKGNGGP